MGAAEIAAIAAAGMAAGAINTRVGSGTLITSPCWSKFGYSRSWAWRWGPAAPK